MKIENLYVGQSFKNYKELCAELGMEIKSSTNSRNAQFKELERYCKFNKIGHKITIEEIYESPIDKVDNRGGNFNTIYGDIIQILIADLLAQCNGHLSISRSKLMNSIGMVNKNYSEGRETVQQLSKYIEIDEKFIYDFYNTSTSNFRSTIETALKSLMDKRVIMYNTLIKVSDKGSFKTRTAKEHELQLIMSIETKTLEEMGYEQISAVRVSKHWKKFKQIVNDLLHDKSDIDFYYTAYDITINEEYITKERNKLVDLLLKKVERAESKDELNKLVYTNTMSNAQKRHAKGSTSGKMSKTRQDNNYVENIKCLADLLIDQKSPYIMQDVKNIKIEKDLFTPELLAELDDLFK
jgi:hypothetical protein